MNICVAGWYFFDQFYDALLCVRWKYPVFVVAHKPVPERFRIFRHKYIMNIGLEFGCYNYFLMNLWNGKSNVLFTHDDTMIGDLAVFDKIAALPHDCAYIFRDYAEEAANGGKHGRAIFMSARFLEFTKNYECDCIEAKGYEDKHHHIGQFLEGQGKHKGFWFDSKNCGHVGGKPPLGIRHYNRSVEHTHSYLGLIRDGKCGNPPMDVVNRVHFPEFECGRRGTWRHKEREIERYGLEKS